METWYELKNKKAQTDEEKMIVVCVEAIHKSKTMETESEEKTYNNLCARVGAEIDGGDEVEKSPLEGDTGNGNGDPKETTNE